MTTQIRHLPRMNPVKWKRGEYWYTITAPTAGFAIGDLVCRADDGQPADASHPDNIAAVLREFNAYRKSPD
jgi:hypothetical protein